METHGWEIKKDSVLLREGTIQEEEVLYLWYKIWIMLAFTLMMSLPCFNK